MGRILSVLRRCVAGVVGQWGYGRGGGGAVVRWWCLIGLFEASASGFWGLGRWGSGCVGFAAGFSGGFGVVVFVVGRTVGGIYIIGWGWSFLFPVVAVVVVVVVTATALGSSWWLGVLTLVVATTFTVVWCGTRSSIGAPVCSFRSFPTRRSMCDGLSVVRGMPWWKIAIDFGADVFTKPVQQ